MTTGQAPDARRRPPIFVVAPACGGARRIAQLLADAAGGGVQVEGSARHALELPQLSARFPRSLFLYVHRDPLATLSEAMAGWRAGRGPRSPQPPGWTGPPWSYALVPGWEELRGRPLAEIVVEQWVRTMRVLVAALDALPPERWCVTSFERARVDPGGELRRLGGFMGIELSAAEVTRRHTEAGDPTPVVPAELVPYLHRVGDLATLAGGWIA